MSDLFEDQDDFFSCQKEWQDMPEYVMEDLTPFRVINVRFRNEEDVKKTLTETIDRIKLEKFDQLNYLKLKNLEESL